MNCALLFLAWHSNVHIFLCALCSVFNEFVWDLNSILNWRHRCFHFTWNQNTKKWWIILHIPIKVSIRSSRKKIFTIRAEEDLENVPIDSNFRNTQLLFVRSFVVCQMHKWLFKLVLPILLKNSQMKQFYVICSPYCPYSIMKIECTWERETFINSFEWILWKIGQVFT